MRASGIALVLGSLAVGLALAELLLRFVYDEEELSAGYFSRGAFVTSEITGYRHAPDFDGIARRKGVFRTSARTNHLGLRQQTLPAQLEFPTKILILGDSFAFGVGVSEEASFPRLLEHELNPHGIGVINGGQSGFSVVQEAKLGQSLAAQFDPDLILVCVFLYNDVEDDYASGYRAVTVKYGFRLYRGRFLGDTLFDYVRTHSYLWMLARSVRDRFRNAAGGEKGADVGERDLAKTMEPTQAAVRELLDFATGKGAKLAVAIIPSVKGPTPYDDRFRAFLKDLGVPTLDLSPTTSTADHYLEGDGHWNETGHAKAAAAIAPFLQEMLR